MARFARFLTLAVALFAAGCIVETFSGFYEGCNVTADCARPADSCYVVAWIDGTGFDHNGGMCSATCAFDSDCPGVAGWSGACIELDGDPLRNLICYQRCGFDVDCAVGFQCVDAVSGGVIVDTICMPS